MFPITLQSWAASPDDDFHSQLPGAMHLYVSTDDFLKIQSLAVPESPFALELPAPIVVFEDDDVSHVFEEDNDGNVFVYALLGGESYLMGKLLKGSNRFQLSTTTRDMPEDALSDFLYFMALKDLFFSLMADPRLIDKSRPSRQSIRAAGRKMSARGSSVPSQWHRLKWTIGEKALQKTSAVRDENWRLPLHLVRGHWRQAKENDPASIQRVNRSGWWTWIKSHFKGHPDFGVRLHHYEPTVSSRPCDEHRARAGFAAAATMVESFRTEGAI